MKAIRIFKNTDREYGMLSHMAALLTDLSPNRYQYYVGDTYFDFGQDWKWTTILCHRPEDSSGWDFQALNPALQEKIITADTPEGVSEAVKAYFNGPYCVDKK